VSANGNPDRVPTWTGAWIGARFGLIVGLLWMIGAFHQLDLRLHDWRYRLRGPMPASDRIALIEVDDATLRAYQGVWPLPRENYAVVIDALENARAQAIGFDLLFFGENREDAAGDHLLATLTAGHDNVVHSISFLPGDVTLGGGPTGPSEKLALIKHGRPVSRQRLAIARHVSLPYDELLANAAELGHTAVVIDGDGVIRRIPQFVRYGDWAYPSLALRLVEVAARADTTLPQFELAADGMQIHWHGRQLRVPSDDEGATSIAFAGDAGAFANRYSLLQVLQWYRDRDTTSLAKAFRGKLVLVGVTAVEQNATDVGPTPFSTAAPLVYIHANAVNSALNGRFIARISPWSLVALVVVLGIALGVLYSRLSLGRAALVAIAAFVGVAALDYALFVAADIDLPPAAGLLVPPLVWIAVENTWRTSAERRARAQRRELDVARSIQQHLLPSKPPSFTNLDVFGFNIPADAIGGDYFDWVALDDDTLAVVVGDISGHGIPAALLMAHLRASLHAEARPGVAPEDIVGAINRSLARAAAPGKFATFFLALISVREQRLRYCNAGHNPPFLLHGGKLELLEATGTPLAMFDGMPYGGGERAFVPGDTLVIYSDGIPEAPIKKDFYGDDRLREKALALSVSAPDAASIGRSILDDLRASAGAGMSADDVTLVVVRRV
jgi:serine phosphatase RsbU (regulator of sigma subunit)